MRESGDSRPKPKKQPISANKINPDPFLYRARISKNEKKRKLKDSSGIDRLCGYKHKTYGPINPQLLPNYSIQRPHKTNQSVHLQRWLLLLLFSSPCTSTCPLHSSLPIFCIPLEQPNPQCSPHSKMPITIVSCVSFVITRNRN